MASRETADLFCRQNRRELVCFLLNPEKPIHWS
jgi:hypothetical protein